MKRKPFITILTLCMALVFSACGGDSSDDSSSTSSPSSSTSEELAVITEMNFARTNPTGYVTSRLVPLRSSYTGGKLDALNECISEMNAMTPVGSLTHDDGLYKAAAAWVQEQGPTGTTGHDANTFSRIEHYYGSYRNVAENIAYGPSTGVEIVRQLLIDYGVTGRTHRKNTLNGNLTKVGVSIGSHASYNYMCCIDFVN